MLPLRAGRRGDSSCRGQDLGGADVGETSVQWGGTHVGGRWMADGGAIDGRQMAYRATNDGGLEADMGAVSSEYNGRWTAALIFLRSMANWRALCWGWRVGRIYRLHIGCRRDGCRPYNGATTPYLRFEPHANNVPSSSHESSEILQYPPRHGWRQGSLQTLVDALMLYRGNWFNNPNVYFVMNNPWRLFFLYTKVSGVICTSSIGEGSNLEFFLLFNFKKIWAMCWLRCVWKRSLCSIRQLFSITNRHPKKKWTHFLDGGC